MSYEAQTGKATVRYDFADGRQLGDFELWRTPDGKHTAARLEGRGSLRVFWPVMEALKTRRFEVDDLRVSFRYGVEWCLGLGFGLGDRLVLRAVNGTVTLSRGKTEIAKNSFSAPAEGTVSVAKEGPAFSVECEGRPVLTAFLPQPVQGAFFCIGSTKENGCFLRELTITGKTSREWLETLSKTAESNTPPSK